MKTTVRIHCVGRMIPMFLSKAGFRTLLFLYTAWAMNIPEPSTGISWLEAIVTENSHRVWVDAGRGRDRDRERGGEGEYEREREKERRKSEIQQSE